MAESRLAPRQWGVSLPSRRVVRILEELIGVHGRPVAFGVNNVPELSAEHFVAWCSS